MFRCWVSFILILGLITNNVKADDCGQPTELPMQLIKAGRDSHLGEWPWHVAVVQRMNLAEDKYACGGTIISTINILTAAHCTYPSTRERRLKPSEILIQAGISNLRQPEESLQQIPVAEIAIHESFDNSTSESDIALLKLDGKLMFSDFVKPIALWRGRADEELIVGKVGHVVGWGQNGRDEFPDQLQHAVMLIASRDKCRASDKNYYTGHLYDRRSFCAGFRNGTSPAAGDSGGGLYIKMGSRWILRGIVSNGKFNRETYQLDTSQYIVFTDVSYFLPWINNQQSVIEPGNIKLPAMDNNGWRSTLPLMSSNHGKHSRLGQWPWHAAVMRRINRAPPLYACGGTIIAERYILTAAYCMYPSSLARRLKPREILIQTGISNLQQLEPHSLQQMRIAKIMIREDYSEIDPVKNDIALLKLVVKLMFTDYVKSICLWKEHLDEQLFVDNLGYIAGWGRNKQGEFSNQLKHEVMLIVSREMCTARDPEYYSRFLSDKKSFCAEFHNGTSLVTGHIGGGLYIEHDGRWILRGITISGKNSSSTKQLDSADYTLFTDIVYFLPWINSKIGLQNGKSVQPVENS